MKPPRILNRGRGRIVPAPSPIHVIDSGRTSFSSASAVSTIDDPEPEAKIPEQVIQKLQQSTETSSTKKILAVGLGIFTIFLILFGIGFGIGYPLSMTTTSTITTTISTTRYATTTILSTITSKTKI